MSHPSGDAIAATEHVVNAVAYTVGQAAESHLSTDNLRLIAVQAIFAYERAMKEVESGS